MSLAEFEQTQPDVTRFFSHALKRQTLSHAYILKGSAVSQSYRLALAIARAVNCQNPPEAGVACGACKDCRWVAANSHPAVITVSRITYIEPDPKTKAFSMIRAPQVNMLLEQLAYSSEHVRVVIFADAEEMPGAFPSSITPPYEWQDKNEGKDKSFHIHPLLHHHFNETSSNRFLKTLEEPPKRTMFFFITDDERNLLETIVSRCQLVRMAGVQQQAPDTLLTDASAFFDQLMPVLGGRDFYQPAEMFRAFLEEKELSPEQGLGLFEAYLRQRFLLLQSAMSSASAADYTRTQRMLDESLRMIRAKVNAEQVLNRLFERLSAQPVG